MATINVALAQYHTGQQQVITEAARYNVVACGRRWGKTFMGLDLAIDPALDGYPTAYYTPTYRMMTEVWRDANRILRDAIVARNKQERRIELYGGGVLDMWSLDDPDTSRGRKYKRAVIDEAAMVRELQYAWQNVIRPTLIDLEGDAWFLSTPKGLNYFWQLFNQGQDPLKPEYKSWQRTTFQNPALPPHELDIIRAKQHELPAEVYAQEYLAEFTPDAGAVFRKVREAIYGDWGDVPREDNLRYYLGGDWGQSQDFTVFYVIDQLGRLVDHSRFNQISWAVQRDRLKAMVNRWNTTTALLEHNSIGNPNIEALHDLNVPGIEPFDTTNASKEEVIRALQLAFEQEQIKIPNDPVLIGELEAFTQTRLASGKWRFEAPVGQHDDCVIALALAWWAKQTGYEPAGYINRPQYASFGY